MRLLATPTELNCRKVLRYLNAYLDGEVRPALVAQIRRHLDDCRRCGLEVEVYAAIKDSVASRDVSVDQFAVRRLEAFTRRLATSVD